MSFTAVRELRIYWEKLLLHLFELLNKIEHILDLAHDVCLRFSKTQGFLQYEDYLASYAASLFPVLQHKKPYKLKNKCKIVECFVLI